ncbi:MAG: MFS transporter [Acidobacteriota bacterium]|nr:MAG: MFS transporter [Acidobacteriota bacterium]
MQRVSKREYRRIVNSWAMYDWANSAFYTTVLAMFPPFFRELARSAGVGEADATAYWAYTTSIGLLAAALLGPILGAISDHTGSKKKYIASFAGLGILATTAMFFLKGADYRFASLLFVLGTVGVAGSNVFYESLLPHIASKEDIDRISTRGYALGYVGGGTLLVINVLWFSFPETFWIPDSETAVRVSFLSVAIWWGLFSIPLMRNVPEPVVVHIRGEGEGALGAGLWRLFQTFLEVRKYRQLLLFLLAFWLYNDGIGTIMKMAVAYGDEIGIGVTEMVVAFALTQFVGIPCTFAFGWLAGRIGVKQAILSGLSVYVVISIFGFFMTTATHFFILAIAVGLVQGGTQALSRSLFSRMIPKGRSAEFFGFFSTSEKLAGMVGPVLFGVVSQLSGESRLSILSLIVFFVGGGLLLSRVNVDEGCRVAQENDLSKGVR